MTNDNQPVHSAWLLTRRQVQVATCINPIFVPRPSRLGVQFPQIQAVLRQQRLAFVQQFVQQVCRPNPVRFRWSSVAECLFERALGPYHSACVTNFLWIDPVPARSELQVCRTGGNKRGDSGFNNGGQYATSRGNG